tara:strand:+ start:1018 stop:1236 length:219 start_codon:yes stop_codon:yes gene_type:complete
MIKKNKIKIKLNGKKIIIKAGSSLKDLILNLNIPLNKTAIELNEIIIDKKKIKNIILKKDDKIEIVHFIGGG